MPQTSAALPALLIPPSQAKMHNSTSCWQFPFALLTDKIILQPKPAPPPPTVLKATQVFDPPPLITWATTETSRHNLLVGRSVCLLIKRVNKTCWRSQQARWPKSGPKINIVIPYFLECQIFPHTTCYYLPSFVRARNRSGLSLPLDGSEICAPASARLAMFLALPPTAWRQG